MKGEVSQKIIDQINECQVLLELPSVDSFISDPRNWFLVSDGHGLFSLKDD